MENEKIVIKLAITRSLCPRVFELIENTPAKYRGEKLRQLLLIGEMFISGKILATREASSQDHHTLVADEDHSDTVSKNSVEAESWNVAEDLQVFINA